MWEKIKIGCVYAIAVSLCIIALSFFIAWIFMLLWNWIIPELFGVSALTYWKAYGILWICHILFKSTNVQWKSE